LLDPPERDALTQAAAFAGHFGIEGAEAVLRVDADVLDVLDALRQRSLLRLIEVDGVPRFALYEPVRAFVDVDEAALGRLADWVAEHGDEWLRHDVATVRREVAHILASARWATGEVGADVAIVAYGAMFLLASPSDAAPFLDRALTDSLSARTAGRLWAKRSDAWRVTANPEQAERAARSGLALDELPDDVAVELWQQLASVWLEQGRAEEVLEALSQLERLAHESSRERIVAQINRGSALRYLGRSAEAVASYALAVQRAMRTDDFHLLGAGLMMQGGLLFELGRLADALPVLRRAEQLFEQRHESRMLAFTRGNLGALYVELGQLDDAEPLLRAALEVCREHGEARVVGIALGNLGAAAQERGELDAAIVLFSEARDIHRGRDKGFEAIAIAQLGAAYHERGWVPRARELYADAEAVMHEVGDLEWVSRIRARLAALESDPARVDASHADPLSRVAAEVHRLAAAGAPWEELERVADAPIAAIGAPSAWAWSGEVRLALRLARPQ
jgi:tetratricopeptide (TPR) repeat protein